ncbi:glycerol kinase GlpK [Propionivibrio dicarboxylicus]|uniref:Glycerol kinase n=1 Tax=Propionivibrio dicarboxylicus TaxID=83767 RepID=A0A1G8LHF0_9RHOO|nr:glycerol kinase GlpK [Propionivibrio dicarboxylicus]SDI55141.1 glycerol kinase [Propionivibrio dicarboxylicus]
MTKEFILALDQGTTSSRAILFDRDGRAVASAQREFAQHYPLPGWVEHDANDIWTSQYDVARAAIANAGIDVRSIAAIGIANQRETTVVWDRETGEPICRAIVWQCRRTAADCEALKTRGLDALIRERTGLLLDAYFSGTKLAWILDHVPQARARAERGELAFGTIDSWLIWKLSGGRVHVTDVSNASRTLLFNIHTLDWDERILAEFDIPRALLPEVKPSSHCYGHSLAALFDGVAIPIAGDAGDQQAALFGQGCFTAGSAKNTYGTGAFMLMNTGKTPIRSRHGLLTTVAWGIDGTVDYALEGSVFIAGAAIQWLRDELGLIGSAAESETLANAVSDTQGVYVVPAFVGLGAPYWDMNARGTIVGLTRGSGRNHIVRATLEAIAFQTRDVLQSMQADAGIALCELRVDGGAAANNFLMQFQADILGVPVLRPAQTESTALGAATLAGLAVGFWKNREDIAGRSQTVRRFTPTLAAEQSERHYAGWRRAVERARAWATD